MTEFESSFGWFVSMDEEKDNKSIVTETKMDSGKNYSLLPSTPSTRDSDTRHNKYKDELYDFDAMFSNQPLDNFGKYLPQAFKDKQSSFWPENVTKIFFNTVNTMISAARKTTVLTKSNALFNVFLVNNKNVVVSLKNKFGC